MEKSKSNFENTHSSFNKHATLRKVVSIDKLPQIANKTSRTRNEDLIFKKSKFRRTKVNLSKRKAIKTEWINTSNNTKLPFRQIQR
jgi:hypothetical protein